MPITIQNSAGGGVTLDSTTTSNETLQLPSGGGTLAPLASPSFTGNVGIGSSSPVRQLEIKDDGTIGQAIVGIIADAGDPAGIFMGTTSNNNAGGIRYFTDTNKLTLRANDEDRLLIDSAGNVGINTATPEANSFEVRDKTIRISKASSVTAYRIIGNDHGNDLSIQGSTVADGNSYNTRFNIANNGRVTLGSGTSPAGHLNCVGEYGQNKRAISFKDVGNGSEVGKIITASSSTQYATTSDYRLKTDVQLMTGAADRVKLLKPCNFEWILDGTRVDGFLAHEAQEVVPEAVTGTKDAMMDEEYEVTPAVLDDEGNETTAAVMGTRSVPDLQGIDQSKLVPLLTATIQELIARIEALENV